MPYKNIVFVKLEKRIFDDHRWYMMSEKSQLNYIRFILFAAHNWNKIPKSITAIKKAFKTDQTEEEIKETIAEIKNSFPKFKENKDFYYFNGFDEKTNYVKHGYPREIPRNSRGLPKEGVEEEKEEEKEKKKRKRPPATDEEFLDTLRKIYTWVNIDAELAKMDGWIMAHPGRTKGRRFIVNWLNKNDKPIKIAVVKPRVAPAYPPPSPEEQKKVREMISETVKNIGTLTAPHPKERMKG